MVWAGGEEKGDTKGLPDRKKEDCHESVHNNGRNYVPKAVALSFLVASIRANPFTLITILKAAINISYCLHSPSFPFRCVSYSKQSSNSQLLFAKAYSMHNPNKAKGCFKTRGCGYRFSTGNVVYTQSFITVIIITIITIINFIKHYTIT